MSPLTAGYVSLHFGSSVACLMALGISICGAYCRCFVLSRDRLDTENDIHLFVQCLEFCDGSHEVFSGLHTRMLKSHGVIICNYSEPKGLVRISLLNHFTSVPRSEVIDVTVTWDRTWGRKIVQYNNLQVLAESTRMLIVLFVGLPFWAAFLRHICSRVRW